MPYPVAFLFVWKGRNVVLLESSNPSGECDRTRIIDLSHVIVPSRNRQDRFDLSSFSMRSLTRSNCSRLHHLVMQSVFLGFSNPRWRFSVKNFDECLFFFVPFYLFFYVLFVRLNVKSFINEFLLGFITILPIPKYFCFF